MTNNEISKQNPPNQNCWPNYSIKPSEVHKECCELVIVADCVSFSCKDFYNEFIQGKNSEIICPKVDNNPDYVNGLSKIISDSTAEKIKIVRINKDCCDCINSLVKQALQLLKKNTPLSETIMDRHGNIISQK